MTTLKFYSSESASFPRNYTLLLPALTHANLPQLAIDLILQTHINTRLGHLRSPSIIPVVTPSAAHGLSTAVELYRLDEPIRGVDGEKEIHLIVMQIRGLYARGRAQEFAEELCRWIERKEHGVCEGIVLITSANAAGRRDALLREGMLDQTLNGSAGRVHSILSQSLRWFCAGGGDDLLLGKRIRSTMNIRVVEGAGDKGWSEKVEEESVLDQVNVIRAAWLPTDRKGNFVRSLLITCEAANQKVFGIMKFAHEGDNREDAVGFAEGIRVAVGLDTTKKLKIPQGWVRNAELPEGLY